MYGDLVKEKGKTIVGKSDGGYTCAEHGDIGKAVLHIDYTDDIKGTYCLRCLLELLTKNIGEVRATKK